MKSNFTKFFWLAWGGVIISIIVGSILPQIPTPEKYNMDKFVHAGAYGLVAFSAFFFSKSRNHFLIILILLILMGGAIEIIQTHIPYRSGTLGDFAADVIGTIGAALLATKIKPLLERRKK